MKSLLKQVVLFVAVLSSASGQTSFTDFVNCVQSTSNGIWGSTCTLPNNTSYDVTSTITAGRAPLTIQGSGSSSTLRRANYQGAANGWPVLRVPSSVTLVGGGPYDVTIKDIRFDGNRTYQCRPDGQCVTVGVPASTYIDAWAGNYKEIEVLASTQSSSVKINNIKLVDAPGYGLIIWRGKYNVNNVDVRYSFFGVSGEGKGCAYLSCILSYADNPGSANDLPYNPVVLWTTFYKAGGGGVAINNAVYPQIMYNQFYGNHWEFPHRSGGGQLYVQYHATANTQSALLYGNYLDGYSAMSSSYGGTAGLEIEGTLHRIESNETLNHKREGIAMNGVNCAKVASNTVTSSGGDYVFGVSAAVQVIASGRPQAADILFQNNIVHDNVVPGFFAWTGGNGVTRIDYSANTSDATKFYNNTGGSVASGSASSATWNSSCGTLP